MGNEQTPNHDEIAQELDLKHVHAVAKKIFDDIIVIGGTEEYIETENMPIPVFDDKPLDQDKNVSPPRIDELKSKVDILWEDYQKSKDPKILKQVDKLKEELFWLEEQGKQDLA